MYYLDPHQPTARAHEWNLLVEREMFANTVVKFGYVGTHGTRMSQWYTFNDSSPAYVWYTTTGLPFPTGEFANVARRPYDQQVYGTVQRYQKTGWSNFNGLQVEFEHRYSKGYAFQMFYVMSNAVRVAGDGWRDDILRPASYYLPGAVPTDDAARNRLLFYRRDTGIPKHRVNWNFLVDLPVGKGKTLGRNANRLVDTLIGGWQIAGYGTLTSRYFQVPTTNWGPTNGVQVYGKQYPIRDCRSGVCYDGWLYWNGYIPANRINSTDPRTGKPNGVMGVPDGYGPFQTPLIPTPKDGGSSSDPNFPFYETNTVFVRLKDGTNQRTSLDTGLHPLQNQFVLGPMIWNMAGSAFKTVRLTERTYLRVNADFLNNVFNMPGTNLPGGDGIISAGRRRHHSQAHIRQLAPGASANDAFDVVAGCLILTAALFQPEVQRATAQRARALVEGGIELSHRGQFNQAAEKFVEALALDPKFAEAHYLLGLVRQQDGPWPPAASRDEAIQSRMLAVQLEKGNVRVAAVPEPLRPSGFALVRLLYGGICNTDLELQRGYYDFQGIPGHEFAGEVIDADDKEWIGKRVVGEINLGCNDCGWCRKGLSRHCPRRTVLGIVQHPGAFQDLFTLPERNLHLIPDRVPLEAVVFTEPLAAACEILDQIRFPCAAEVAVLGDGKLGLLIALALNAHGLKVLQFGRHPEKLRIAGKQGVHTEVIRGPLPERAYEWVVDATGSSEGLAQAVQMVLPRGSVVMKSTIHGAVALNTAPIIVNEVTLIGSRCGRFEPALQLLAQKIIPVEDLISEILPLAEASRAFEQAAKKGTLKVLLAGG